MDDTYEYRKTARYEVTEKNVKHVVGKWDQNGRYFVLFGKKSSPYDKQTKSIKIYNMFGELLQQFKDIQGLESVQFRPRPTGILKKDAAAKLKKTFKTKYEKIFKEEEAQEKKAMADVVKEQRKVIRDDFLNNFFVPLRQQYESKIDEHKALFPIKEKDMAEESASYHNIYAFKEVISQRRIEGGFV